MKIKKIKSVDTERVYDITVAENPNYILKNGVITHNSGLKYAASVILFLSKKKDKEGTDVIGNIIRVKAVKSRFTKQDKVIEVKLSYVKGLDRYYGLLPIAEKYGIFKKVGKKIEVSEGVTVFENRIHKDPTKFYTPEVMEKLERACATEFKYGPGDFMESNDVETEDDEITEE